MRGGKREGAGRKASEPTIRVSVPEGIAEMVHMLVTAYKSGKRKELSQLEQLAYLLTSQTPKESHDDPVKPVDPSELNTCQLIKDAITSSDSDDSERDALEIEEPAIYHAELEQLYAESERASTEICRGVDSDLLPNDNQDRKSSNNTSLDLDFVPDQQEIQSALRKLEKLSTADRKILKNSFGSLYEAAKLGVRAEGKNFSFPSSLESRLKIPRNSRISY